VPARYRSIYERSAYWPWPGVWSSCETSGRLSAVAGCSSSAAASASAPSGERASSRYKIRCPASGAGASDRAVTASHTSMAVLAERVMAPDILSWNPAPWNTVVIPAALSLPSSEVTAKSHGRCTPGRGARSRSSASLCTSMRPGTHSSPPPSRSAADPEGAGPTSAISPSRTTTRALSMTASGSTARTPPST
jgi:hypothetical protein